MIQEVQIALKTDNKGMLGRECPNEACALYFKLKPGTGLPTDVTRCPYCETKGNPADFLTTDQLKYAQMAGAKKILDPILTKVAKDIDRLNRRQRGGLIQLEFSVERRGIRLHDYVEEQLETEVTCDRCGLEFAVYGVFCSCPDCGQLNALKVCLGSLETAKKKLMLSEDKDFDTDLRRDFLQDALGGAVAAFDAYGKALRDRRGVIYSKVKTNLFQDIEMLDVELLKVGLPSVAQLIGMEACEDMRWFFQARHIYSHNAGVVDARFVAKQPTYAHMLGRLLPLDTDRIRKNIEALSRLAGELDAKFK